jgi:hypothetical protein
MRLAAGGAPVAVNCRVVEPVNKVKTSLYFSILERSKLNLIRSCTINISTHYVLNIVYKSAVRIIEMVRCFEAVSNKFNLLNLYLSSKFIAKIEFKSNNNS